MIFSRVITSVLPLLRSHIGSDSNHETVLAGLRLLRELFNDKSAVETTVS